MNQVYCLLTSFLWKFSFHQFLSKTSSNCNQSLFESIVHWLSFWNKFYLTTDWKWRKFATSLGSSALHWDLRKLWILILLWKIPKFLCRSCPLHFRFDLVDFSQSFVLLLDSWNLNLIWSFDEWRKSSNIHSWFLVKIIDFQSSFFLIWSHLNISSFYRWFLRLEYFFQLLILLL